MRFNLLLKYQVLENNLQKRTRNKSPFPPQQSPSFIRILSAKKAFTPSKNGFFFLIFKRFKCEGFIFQVFTAQEAYPVVFLLIFGHFSGVKACSFNPSQAFTVRVNALLPM